MFEVYGEIPLEAQVEGKRVLRAAQTAAHLMFKMAASINVHVSADVARAIARESGKPLENIGKPTFFRYYNAMKQVIGVHVVEDAIEIAFLSEVDVPDDEATRMSGETMMPIEDGNAAKENTNA